MVFNMFWHVSNSFKLNMTLCWIYRILPIINIQIDHHNEFQQYSGTPTRLFLDLTDNHIIGLFRILTTYYYHSYNSFKILNMDFLIVLNNYRDLYYQVIIDIKMK